MNTASDRKDTAEIVTLGEARAQRDAAAPTLGNAGAMLRAAREDSGYAIADVSAEINVKPERLEAIEAMDLGGLPSAPYSLGFVRAYAGFLGLPVEPLVARFREEAGWARPVTAPVVKGPPPVSRDREIGLLGILVVVGFIVWALWQIVGRTPEEDAALPQGFPIADRTDTPQVVPEVTTSLEDDLTRTPPVRVDEGEGPTNGESAAGGQADGAQAEAEADTAQLGPRRTTPDRATPDQAAAPPLVPLVLAPPTAAPAEPVSDPAPEPEPARAPSSADALNERLLREVMADSAPSSGRAAPVGGSADPAPASADEAARADPARGEAAGAEAVRAEAAPASRVAARLTDPVSPVYPRRCRRSAAEEEVVTVRFTVSRAGRVIGPSVVSSSNGCFDDAALSAVSRFGFEPATENGRVVAEAARSSRIVFRKP